MAESEKDGDPDLLYPNDTVVEPVGVTDDDLRVKDTVLDVVGDTKILCEGVGDRVKDTDELGGMDLDAERDNVTDGDAAGDPKPRVHVGVGLRVAGDREGLNNPDEVFDTETDFDTETERDNAGDIERDPVTLAPNVAEREVVGLTEEVAAGHPNPRVHVGVGVRVETDGADERERETEMVAVRDPVIEPDAL